MPGGLQILAHMRQDSLQPTTKPCSRPAPSARVVAPSIRHPEHGCFRRCCLRRGKRRQRRGGNVLSPGKPHRRPVLPEKRLGCRKRFAPDRETAIRRQGQDRGWRHGSSLASNTRKRIPLPTERFHRDSCDRARTCANARCSRTVALCASAQTFLRGCGKPSRTGAKGFRRESRRCDPPVCTPTVFGQPAVRSPTGRLNRAFRQPDASAVTCRPPIDAGRLSAPVCIFPRKLAEWEGFEPSGRLITAHSLSRGALSTAQPPLRSPFYHGSRGNGGGVARSRRLQRRASGPQHAAWPWTTGRSPDESPKVSASPQSTPCGPDLRRRRRRPPVLARTLCHATKRRRGNPVSNGDSIAGKALP